MKYSEFNLNQALKTAGLNIDKVELISANRCQQGLHLRLRHYAETLNCDMIVGIYLPPCVLTDEAYRSPALYWLSGLTCNDQNFLTKAGAMQRASELGLVLICPDTSPRGAKVADDDGYDLGQGASFYVDATQEPWKKHYQMYSYVSEELIEWCEENLPISKLRSIAGHSMGGHGALTIAFKNPESYRSISAFAPICNPTRVPWGKKAFLAYLGENKELWDSYDACELLSKLSQKLPLLIDQGTQDEFLAEQLSTQEFASVCKHYKYPLILRMQDGYDHSYFFIASFINDHLEHHAKALGLS